MSKRMLRASISLFTFLPMLVYSSENFIMVVNSDLKAMLYNRGLLINSWNAHRVDGFAIGGKVMSFSEFAELSYIAVENQLWKVDATLGTKANRMCRMYSKSTYEGERLQFYVGDGSGRRYIVFDDREDYLQFRCLEE